MQQCPHFRPHYVNLLLIPDRGMHVASCGCALGCGRASEHFWVVQNDMHGAQTRQTNGQSLGVIFSFILSSVHDGTQFQ